MLNGLRQTSKILILIPIGVLLYDLVKGWFVDNNVEIRSFEKWSIWFFSRPTYNSIKEVLDVVLGHKWSGAFVQWPAPLALAVIPVLMYVIYWIGFKLKGGNTTGGYTYKSRD